MKDGGQPRSLALWVVWTIALLILYVGSLGPVVKFVDHSKVPKPIAYVYMPLAWLTDVFEPADDFVKWYLTRVWNCDID